MGFSDGLSRVTPQRLSTYDGHDWASWAWPKADALPTGTERPPSPSSRPGDVYRTRNRTTDGLLYRTRFGAYFAVSFHDGVEPWEDDYEKLTPLDPEQALRSAERYCSIEEIETLFGEQPEAGASEAKVRLRMPEILRRRLAMLAEGQRQSMNAYIVRCLEACTRGAMDRRS